MSAGVVLLGAAGRMGAAMTRLLSEGAVPALRLAAAVERPGHPRLGQEVAPGVRLADRLEDAFAAAPAVAVDFSHPDAVPDRAAALSAAGIAWVLGTTGVSPDGLAAITDAATRIPVLHSANMCLGVHLLAALVRQAAAALRGRGYDCEITERHHRHKADAPSGTALLLGKAAAAGYGWNLAEVERDGRSGRPGPRPEREIGFHAVRAGGIVGEHEVLFADEGESITLSHRLASRDTLALGALRAAEWLCAAPRAPGLYDMEDVLGLPKPD